MVSWCDLIIFGVFLYFWTGFSTALHEAAHVVAGRAVGFAPHQMIVGTGPVVFRKTLFGVDVRWCLNPFSGFAFASRTPLDGLWWRGSFFVGAGPVVEIALGLLIGLPLYLEVSKPGNDSGWQILLCILATVQAGRLLGNIWPRDIQTASGVTPNDGKAFLSYITGRKTRELERLTQVYAEGVARYEPAFRPRDAWFLQVSGATARVFAQAERDLVGHHLESAVEKYLGIVEGQPLSRGEKAMILDILAGLPVILGESRYLEEALEWVRRARELCPESVTLAGTQGSLLVESGRYREGIAMLQPLTGPGNTPGDLAISACYLAKAWDRLGDEKQAARWFKLAKENGGSPAVCALIGPQLSVSKTQEGKSTATNE